MSQAGQSSSAAHGLMLVSTPIVTPHQGHRLRMSWHHGERVVVKRIAPGSMAWKTESWSRSLLASASVLLAPPLHWVAQTDEYTEFAVTYVPQTAQRLRAASPESIENLGGMLGLMHARCAQPPDSRAPWLRRASASLETLERLAGWDASQVSAAVAGLTVASTTAPVTLVHRDLTDANILISGDRPWIIDWEVATLAHPDLDLARLALALSPSQHAHLAQAYQSGYQSVRPFAQTRLESGHQAIFTLLFCAEMLAHLERCNELRGAYAHELIDMAARKDSQLHDPGT